MGAKKRSPGGSVGGERRCGPISPRRVSPRQGKLNCELISVRAEGKKGSRSKKMGVPYQTPGQGISTLARRGKRWEEETGRSKLPASTEFDSDRVAVPRERKPRKEKEDLRNKGEFLQCKSKC